MNNKSILSAIFLISIGIIFGVILVSSFNNGIDFSLAREEKISLGVPSPLSSQSTDIKSFNQSFIDVSKLVTPTVVSINVTVKVDEKSDRFKDFFHFFGPDFKFPEPQPQEGSGSGVIINPKGYILTNNHVVAGAKEDGIEVILNDKRRFKNAKIIGTDPTTDMAIIKIDANDLPTASLGNSEDLQVGEWVIAVGNPLGLQSTVTAGIVSAIGRGNIGVIRDSYGIESFIQTDAAINPGNSGGPLVNLKGEVVGINTAIATTNARYQGYGFAVPINIAKYVAQDLIEFGKVRRGYLGVQIRAIDETDAKAFKLEKTTGVLINNVIKDGAAEKAGLKAGDIILEIDGKEMKAPNQVQSYIATKHPGDVVEIKLNRDGKKIEKKVKLAARTGDDEVITAKEEKTEKKKDDQETISSVNFEKLGFSVRTLSSKEKKDLKVDSGVLVANIKRNSDAAQRGLAQSDVILEINRQPVSSAKEVKEIIEKSKPGDSILLRVRKSEDTSSFIAIEIPK
ncbi:MAG: Do family serine endopeptidase [Bacteroidota bacterium]|nr:Do family serine endopeptidase [Bacteroidota bacterium]